MYVIVILVDGMATTYDEYLPGQQVRIGIEIIVHRQHILCTLIMTVVQAFFAHRDKLAFIIGGTAAFCKPVNRCIPKDILFAVHDAMDIGLEVIVLVNRDGVFKFLYRKQAREIVFSSKFGVLG